MNNLVYRFYFLQLLDKLLIVWLQDLYKHIIHVVFNELEHSMAQRIGHLKLSLNIALLD
jgi:hypothetical protein